MTRKLIVTFLTVLMAICISTDADARSKRKKKGKPTIKVETLLEISVMPRSDEEAGRVEAKLKFTNIGKTPIEVVKFVTAHDGKLNGNYFQVFNSAAESLEYKGPMAKMEEPGSDGFFQLKPGDSIEGKANLTENYQFSGTKDSYSVYFDADNFFSKNKGHFTSNTVNFEY